MRCLRKSYEVVGYYHDGAFYCATHAPNARTPVFLNDCAPDDYCDTCMHRWIASATTDERKDGAPPHVYLDGEGPRRDDPDETDPAVDE